MGDLPPPCMLTWMCSDWQAFIAVCTALGARSSSHSEILQQVGPSLSTVDDELEGQFTPGGFSEWGLRRDRACAALGLKAINAAMVVVEAHASFKTLRLALAAGTVAPDRARARPLTVLAIRIWRALVADPATDPAEAGVLLNSIGPVLLMRDYFYAMFATSSKPEL